MIQKRQNGYYVVGRSMNSINKITFSISKYRIILAVICLTRLWLGLQLPRYISGNSIHDDILFINLTNNLLNGRWLGEYSSAVLNKSPGYSFFLLLPAITGISYSFWCEFFWICAVLLSMWAFSSVLDTYPKKIFWLLALLFNPVSFDSAMSLRIYRNTLVPSTVLCVISTFSALYLHADMPFKKLIGWSCGAGVSVFFFYILREDSIWLFPFIIGEIGRAHV